MPTRPARVITDDDASWLVMPDGQRVRLPTGGGGGGTMPTRQSASLTTGTLAAGASATGTLTLAAAYRLYTISTSDPARVRIYTSTGKRDADLSRPIGTDPTGDHGLMLEFVSTAGLPGADLSPLVDGFDPDSDGLVPWAVTNTGTSSAAITVTLTYLRTEG